MVHPQTIKKYTSALLSTFSDIETEYESTSGEISLVKIPIFYAKREKMLSMTEHDLNKIYKGNVNFYPRGSLSLETMEPEPDRTTNKNIPVSSTVNIPSLSTDTPFVETLAAPSPYAFTFNMSILTRGMTSASMIAEQVGAQFRPTLLLKMNDAELLTKETDIHVEIVDIQFETQDYDEFSNNLITVDFTFVLHGNLYKPVNTAPAVTDISFGLSSF